MPYVTKVYGGPGCGKTYTMLGHFEHELKNYAPEEIAFLTFTRAARQEAISRTGRAADELPFVRTIHALCYRQLKLTQARVVSPHDLKKFGATLGVKFSGTRLGYSEDVDYQVVNDLTVGDRVLQVCHHLAQHMEEAPGRLLHRLPDIQPRFATWLLDSYNTWKAAQGQLDYTDLLLKFLARGQPIDGLKVLFVDEAQDLSPLQWRVVELLASTTLRVYMGGDDDQAIFQWCGASPRAFNDFPAAEVKVLPKSHRLPRPVWKQVQNIASRITDRYPKRYTHDDHEGEVLFSAFPRHEHFKAARTFVLYRNHYRGAELAQRLRHLAVPFGGLSPLDDEEVVLAIDAFRLALDRQPLRKDHLPAITRFYNSAYLAMAPSARSLGAIAPHLVLNPVPDHLEQFSAYLHRLPELDYLSAAVKHHGLADTLKPKTRLMSIHQSKGQEADTVLLDVEMSRRTFEAMYGLAGKSPNEEHRVFYVAASRAKQRLVVLQPSSQFNYAFLVKKVMYNG